MISSVPRLPVEGDTRGNFGSIDVPGLRRCRPQPKGTPCQSESARNRRASTIGCASSRRTSTASPGSHNGYPAVGGPPARLLGRCACGWVRSRRLVAGFDASAAVFKGSKPAGPRGRGGQSVILDIGPFRRSRRRHGRLWRGQGGSWSGRSRGSPRTWGPTSNRPGWTSRAWPSRGRSTQRRQWSVRQVHAANR